METTFNEVNKLLFYQLAAALTAQIFLSATSLKSVMCKAQNEAILLPSQN